MLAAGLKEMKTISEKMNYKSKGKNPSQNIPQH
jgi:hypothetical protein